MITDVVIVPGAPLLLPEYQGRAPAVPGLLESCVAAVRDAVATAAHVVVVHASDREPRSARPAVGLRVADHLLAETHVGFSVEHVAVAWDATVEQCVATGRAVASSTDETSTGAGGGAAAPRTTVLVVADGSARRTEKAPGHLDPRSHEVDDAIVAAVRNSAAGGLGRLLELDPVLCADLLVAGRAPLQVLAAAVAAAVEGDAEREGTAYGRFEVVSCEVSDPFGVLYVVAHLARTH